MSHAEKGTQIGFLIRDRDKSPAPSMMSSYPKGSG